jgi:Cu/Ag efflux protein CusF
MKKWLSQNVSVVSLSNTKQPMTAKLLSLIVGLAVVFNATAADTKPTTASKFPKRYPYHANVAAIDVAAKTITLDGKKKQRVLFITPTTRILKDKKPVALETIKAGDYVTGSLVDTDGHLEPTTVNVGGTSSKKVALTSRPAAPASAPQNNSVNVTRPNQSSAIRKP